jgi:predicted transcriptional regulator
MSGFAGIGGRRSRLDMCFDILDEVWSHGEIKPTQLMYKTNLSWKVLTETVAYLCDRGLVKTVEVGPRRLIGLTEAGVSCVSSLHAARSLVSHEPEPEPVFEYVAEKVLPSLPPPGTPKASTGKYAW